MNPLPYGTNATSKEGATWNALGLLPQIVSTIENVFKFKNLTPVQSATLPHFLKFKDVAVEVR